ncbi:MAG: cytochrome c, partial [Verrucomicrobiaceae bacterium]
MKPHLSAAILAASTFCSAQDAPDGASLYTLNCAACHLLDQSLVGPSLVEIRTLYRGKPDDFVKWAIAPGRKRPGAVEMPSMVHVGEPGLRAIHAHMIAIAEGAKEKKVAKGDPFAQSPTQTARPQVQRIFLPDAGPAAIAIALDDQTSLCWDAGACRLRYAWTGGFLDGYPYWKGNGSSMAKIKGTIRYREPAPLLNGAAKFYG